MATGRVPTTANSPLTAKGDLFTYSTAPARLAVGNNGEQIVADSAATTGLRYSATPSASNPVLNSAMQVWQRGTTFAISNTSAYTADRWQGRVTAVCTTSFSRQATGDTTNLPNIQYATRVQRTSGQTATPAMLLEQSFESVNSIPFAGKTVTLSFYARAGANYSAASNALTMYLYSGTGTDQNISGAYTGLATVITGTATLTTTWQRFTFTGTVASTATELALSTQYNTVGTAGAADYFDLTGVQIDIGSVALPFRTNGGTIQGELAACQRYYYRIGGDAAYTYFVQGQADSTTTAKGTFYFPVTMRTLPSAFEVSANSTFYYFIGAGSVVTPSSVNWGSTGSSRNTSQITIGGTFTSKDPVTLTGAATTNAYLGWSAEL